MTGEGSTGGICWGPVSGRRSTGNEEIKDQLTQWKEAGFREERKNKGLSGYSGWELGVRMARGETIPRYTEVTRKWDKKRVGKKKEEIRGFEFERILGPARL